ncbi:conserved hypothetical protein [Candidatus Terasakiella magnetica]|nr:conserved hypothetical protein [Candidatus Terasakiella magnetica]
MRQDGQTSLAAGFLGLPSARSVRGSLARKVSLALVSILVFTLLLAAFFAYYKFESVYSSLVQSRYSFVVFTVKKKVEDSLNLGLALRQLRQVQEIIEREKARDSQILSIQVYDAQGEVLFDTDRGAIGTFVGSGLVDAAKASSAQSFGATDDDMLIVGLPLVNTLGKVEGGILLRYPQAYVEHGVGGLLIQLSRTTAELLAVFSVLAVAGLYILFGRVSRKLGSMERTLGTVLSEGGQAVPEAGGDPFEERFAEFVTKSREATDHIREATEEIGRLDRLA